MSEQKPNQNILTSSSGIVARTTTSSNIVQARRRIAQNYSLIWIDGTIDKSEEDWQKDLSQVQGIISDVNIFTQPDECIQFLNTINLEKVFLIASGFLGHDLVPEIYDMPQIDAIYIFCGSEARHKAWAKEWPRIQGVFTSIEDMCKSLKKVARESDHNAIPMSFIAKETLTTASGQQSIDQLELAYMYSMLFKEIILEIDDDDAKSLNDLVIYCCSKGISKSQLKYFQQEYRQKSPIWWYTDEIFLYSMLNKALRLLDMEGMTKMGFFIRNLHQQLEQLHREQSGAYKKQFVIYRGQGLSQQDFEHLLETKGGFLSFNNFLLTTTKQQIAMEFVQHALQKYEDYIGVLFVMTIDPSTVLASSTSFALIDEYSAIKDENEILFSMHTVFRVGEIKQMVNKSRLWEIQLTLTADNDPQLAALTHIIREETQGSTGWHRLGHLMLKVGHFNQAEELYNKLLKNASNDSDRADIYHMLGYLKNAHGQYKGAASFYEKSLEIKRKIFPKDHPSLASTYNNIGLAYNNMGDYLKALEFYDKARNIKEKTLPPNHPDLATSYNNIGGAYNDMGDYLKALEFYDKAHKIRENTLPSNHSLLATSYNNIGGAYNDMGDYLKALEFYDKALKIREKTLSPNHLLLATSYNNVGGTYNDMGDYSKALKFHDKALEIREKTLPPNHPSLATSYNNIGNAYFGMGDYSKALSFLERSLVILQKSLPPTHPLIKTATNNINSVKKKM